ncbi:MAG TPA: SH3 domain-containing protein [Lichenihabitans sp.]|jgi:hypothetical protein|nr:SH3 domain-containing protein [Lichenihabitans sp.]
MSKAIAVGAATLILSISCAMAQEHRCHVVDPTGTPLNVRSTPSGTIVGTLANGVVVYVIDHATDTRGKPWVYVGDSATTTPIGWVYRQFIDCFR